MSTTPNPDPTPARRRRKADEPKGWKAIPTPVKVLFGVCLLVVIVVPLVTKKSREGLAPMSATQSAIIEGLTLPEVGLDPATKRVKGIVSNGTDKSVRDVQVSFDIRNGLQAMGIVVAKVPQIAPHQTARFETNPLPAGGREYLLREVTAAAQ